ncbi:MAG: aminomethyl-transferring glycine dehydrogenase, partial [Limisphaerales bacterium]
MTASHAAFAHPDTFVHRHIGPRPAEAAEMLKTLGFDSLDAMIDTLVPADIRLSHPLTLPAPLSEFDALRQLKAIAGKNQVFKSCIGMGYHDCITPPVIQRNILENPGWYTQYTPYQAEISQGRLEALLNFQTMICDLTGLDIANASMLDEATAAAEAMTLCHRAMAPGDSRAKFFVSDACHPQTVALVKTRAAALKLEVVVGNHETFAFDNTVFGALVQYPTTTGSVLDYADFAAKAHAAGALVVVAADILALTVLRAPGEFGADVCIGSAQRFGVPLGYGGPHAAFFATRDAFKRNMPGRLVGVSKDARGKAGLRLALGTREQHIRREKATSNICTAQALLANIAAMYAVYHGPEGLKAIALRVHRHTRVLAAGVTKLGHAVLNTTCFDTLAIRLKGYTSKEIITVAEKHGVNLRTLGKDTLGVALDETTDLADVELLVRIFNAGFETPFKLEEFYAQAEACDYAAFARTSKFLTAPVFNCHHSETEMLRYLRKLESRDLSLCQAMIPLGSCTMKLNATSEMLPVTWPEFGKIHPFAPLKQTLGYQELFQQLEQWLAEVTGFAGVSLQPNSGSAGEYTGLLVIHKYHQSRGEAHRDICLIPNSAHGTNPASAAMAGLKVVAVACDAQGNIDMADLRAKAAAHAANLACLMVTYPSTHGVFEGTIREICQIIHDAGGQVYMDGANMNAQVGLTSPGFIGADVCHLNLHKTFCIPHGGGGPGVGPIGVAEHLVDFLPDHPVVP